MTQQKLIPSFPTYLTTEEQSRVAATDIGWVIVPLGQTKQQPDLLSVHRGLRSLIIATPMYSNYMKYVKDSTTPAAPIATVSSAIDKPPTIDGVAGIPFECNVSRTAFNLTKIDPSTAIPKVTIQGKSKGLSYSFATSQVTGSILEVGVIPITIELTDPVSGAVETTQVTVNIVPNPPPTVMNEIPILLWTAGVPFRFIVPENVFYDSAHGDKLTYSIGEWENIEFPTWLKVEEKDIVGVTGQPQTSCFALIATDLAGNSVKTKVVIIVAEPATFEAVELKTSHKKQSLSVGSYYELKADKLFNCVDLINKLKYSIEKVGKKQVPSWLSINQVTGKLEGTPEKAGSFTINIVATDLVGRKVSYGPMEFNILNVGAA